MRPQINASAAAVLVTDRAVALIVVVVLLRFPQKGLLSSMEREDTFFPSVDALHSMFA